MVKLISEDEECEKALEAGKHPFLREVLLGLECCEGRTS